MSHTKSMRSKFNRAKHHETRKHHSKGHQRGGHQTGQNMATEVVGPVNFHLMTDPIVFAYHPGRAQRRRGGDRSTPGQRRVAEIKKGNFRFFKPPEEIIPGRPKGCDVMPNSLECRNKRRVIGAEVCDRCTAR